MAACSATAGRLVQALPVLPNEPPLGTLRRGGAGSGLGMPGPISAHCVLHDHRHASFSVQPEPQRTHPRADAGRFEGAPCQVLHEHMWCWATWAQGHHLLSPGCPAARLVGRPPAGSQAAQSQQAGSGGGGRWGAHTHTSWLKLCWWPCASTGPAALRPSSVCRTAQQSPSCHRLECFLTGSALSLPPTAGQHGGCRD